MSKTKALLLFLWKCCSGPGVILAHMFLWGISTTILLCFADNGKGLVFSELNTITIFLGGFLSFALVFRTNICYARWWEGRCLWGSLIYAAINVVQQGRTWIHDENRLHRLACAAIAFGYVQLVVSFELSILSSGTWLALCSTKSSVSSTCTNGAACGGSHGERSCLALRTQGRCCGAIQKMSGWAAWSLARQRIGRRSLPRRLSYRQNPRAPAKLSQTARSPRPAPPPRRAGGPPPHRHDPPRATAQSRFRPHQR